MTAALEMLKIRIEAISWEEDLDRTASRVLLAKEFLRRAALWGQALDPVRFWPFFDLAEAIDPDFRADPAVVREVMGSLEGRDISRWAKRVIEWELHLTALGRKGFSLPDPYEPLLVMFERGGTFSSETGFLNVDHVGAVWIEDWRKHLSGEPLTTLDEAELDALDGL